jgi:SAM-dependent methyltransferase
MIDGSSQKIDFETDKLPYADASIDTVILNNVLEHIYNHNHLVKEINRILKKDGTFVGFVPFIIQYHPDPHDYFRYTKEALERIFSDARFTNIRIQAVGMGPIMANFNSIMLYMPRITRCLLFPFYLLVAQSTVALSPVLLERYPLGFTFIMNK